VLNIFYRCIATYLIKKARSSHRMARTVAVLPSQRFGTALDLNVPFHMPFADRAKVGYRVGALRSPWVNAPTAAERTRLTQILALRIGGHLESQGLLERHAENGNLAADGLEAGPMEALRGSSITSRFAVGPQQVRKVFTVQTLPSCDGSFDDGFGKVAGFSLHAGVTAQTDPRQRLELLCR
jgi:hypothetical protein